MIWFLALEGKLLRDTGYVTDCKKYQPSRISKHKTSKGDVYTFVVPYS